MLCPANTLSMSRIFIDRDPFGIAWDLDRDCPAYIIIYNYKEYNNKAYIIIKK